MHFFSSNAFDFRTSSFIAFTLTTKNAMQRKHCRQDISSCLWKPTSILRSFRLFVIWKKQKGLGIEIAMYLCCSELFWYVWLAHFPLEMKFKFYIGNVITSFAVTVLAILIEMFCSFLSGFNYCLITVIYINYWNKHQLEKRLLKNNLDYTAVDDLLSAFPCARKLIFVVNGSLLILLQF